MGRGLGALKELKSKKKKPKNRRKRIRLLFLVLQNDCFVLYTLCTILHLFAARDFFLGLHTQFTQKSQFLDTRFNACYDGEVEYFSCSMISERRGSSLSQNRRKQGSFVCAQENKVTDEAMFIVFDIENEACLSGNRGPREL